MRIECGPNEHYGGGEDAVTLIVSRRNLLTLLAKLDGHPPDSTCTIGAPEIYGAYFIRAEEDDVHYSHPDRYEDDGRGPMPPGRMHPETEAAIG